MDQRSLEGTTINIKPQFNKKSQEQVEEVATGNPISGKKQDFQNPEGSTDHGKQDKTIREKMAQLWAEMTNLKKIILIGSIVLAIIIIVMVTLLIIALSYKPKVVIRNTATLPMPNSNERLNFYEVQGSKQNLIGPNKNQTFAMTTIDTATARMMQQGTTEDVRATAIILQFDHPQTGVSIKATSADDLTIHVDYDQVINSYSNKRLLFELEMRSAFRLLQEGTSAPAENALSFDDSSVIIKDAESSLVKAVASATGTNTSDLALEYSQTITIVQQPDGNYTADTNAKSSRLLWALSNIRGLKQWEPIFHEIVNDVLVPKIDQAKASINEFFNGQDGNTQNNASSMIKNSNFGTGADIDIVQTDSAPAATARLLQDSSTNNSTSNPTSPTSSNNTSNTTKTKPIKRRPINPKNRKNKGKAPKQKNITGQAYYASMNCTGHHKRRVCDLRVINGPASPYRFNRNQFNNRTLFRNFTTRPRHTVCYKNNSAVNPKPKSNNIDSNSTAKNLKTEPTPAAPKDTQSTTPTTPANAQLSSPSNSSPTAITPTPTADNSLSKTESSSSSTTPTAVAANASPAPPAVVVSNP